MLLKCLLHGLNCNCFIPLSSFCSLFSYMLFLSFFACSPSFFFLKLSFNKAQLCRLIVCLLEIWSNSHYLNISYKKWPFNLYPVRIHNYISPQSKQFFIFLLVDFPSMIDVFMLSVTMHQIGVILNFSMSHTFSLLFKSVHFSFEMILTCVSFILFSLPPN